MKARCRMQYFRADMCSSMPPLPCLNACNKRGTCISGFCKCLPGYYGADCALSMGPGGSPQLLAGQGYRPRDKRPYVYVYELPPHLTTWTNTRRFDRPLHIQFQQRLLSSGARMADGDAADWFFIPVRQRSHADSHFMASALRYIREHWPYWNRTNGHRHFAFHTGDTGTWELHWQVRQAAANVTWLTHWGITKDKPASNWRKTHRLDKDVVVPVYLSSRHFVRFAMERSPLHPANPQPQRDTTLFFAGRICGDRKPPRLDGVWPHCGPRSSGYSAGVRQAVHFHHWNRTGYRITLREKRYGHLLMTSRFCLAPLGGGHGQRQMIVAFMGCVPVPIADHVCEPFEPQMDWPQFAMRPAEADIPRLHEILAAVLDEKLRQMQASLRCAAQHLAYSSVVGGFMGEDGRYDAFETVLEVLRVKALHPGAPPDQYRFLDQDFADFMACREPKGFRSIGPQVWPPALAQPGVQAAGAAAAAGAAQGAVGGGAGGDVKRLLCSHALVDRPINPCEPILRKKSTTFLIPGGVLCAGSGSNLTACPRLWQ